MLTTSVKQIVLAAFTAAANIFALWLWKNNMSILLQGEFQHYAAFFLPLFALLVAASLFSLVALFIENVWLSYGATFVGLLSPLLFLQATNVVLGTLVFIVLLFIMALHRIRKEFAFSIEFSVVKILRNGLPIYFTVMSLIISLFYLSHLDQKSAMLSFFPKPLFDITLKHFSHPLESLSGISGIDANTTIADVLERAARRNFHEQYPGASISDADLARVLAQERAAFEKQYGISVKGDERLADFFQNAVVRYLDRMLGSYQQYVPFAAAATFFFALKLLTLPLYYAALFLTFLLIRVMQYGKLLTKRVQQIEVERLSL